MNVDAALTAYGEEKPRLRGVSHQYAFFFFTAANALLLWLAVGARAKFGVFIYALSVSTLYAASSMYHRGTWSDVVTQRIRRLDHSSIFLVIAGSYTPVFMLLLPAEQLPIGLGLVWGLSILGIAKSLLWVSSPKWVTTLLAIGAGWSGAYYVVELKVQMGAVPFMLLMGCGLSYTIGGIIYARKRPDPLPKVFGYHEIFHALVILGCLFHHVHVWLVLDLFGALSR